MLSGRYAGKKAVLVKTYDDGTTARPYGHALVCGLAKEPRRVRGSVPARPTIFLCAPVEIVSYPWHEYVARRCAGTRMHTIGLLPGV